MKQILAFVLMLCLGKGGFATNIVPLPYQVEAIGKTYTLPRINDLEKILSGNDYSTWKSLHIGIRHQNKNFDALCHKLGFFTVDIGEEGYELLIDNKQIVLAANTEKGIFYGKQSLKQLIRSAKQNKLQGLRIIDKPAFRYRGVMDDISRGPVPSTDYMKYQIRRMSELKLNMLCYYTEHVVLTRSHPEFAPPAGGISIAEWKEIEEYARQHFVELVPNFQSLGHAEKVLQSPKYRSLGESSTMYSPVKPEVVQFMKDIYDEMCPAFSSNFFHVNCDETFDLGRGASKKLADSIGISGVYARYVNQLADILRNNGKRMMIWGDIALQHPEILEMLPSDAVIMSWEYGDQKSFAAWIDPFIKKGFDCFVCPGVLNSYRLFPDYAQALPNIRNFIREGQKKGALGVLNTVWDDGGLHSFNRDWYGVAYGAEHSWNPNDRPVEDFDTRLSAGIYKNAGAPLFESIHLLREMGTIQALGGMNDQVFLKKLIPARGQYVSYSLSDWDEVYRQCQKIDSTLAENAVSGFEQEYAAIQIVSDEYKYLSQAKLRLAEAANWYAQACCVQYSDRKEASLLIDKVRTNITYCREQFGQLKTDFEAIWKNENRDYWFNYTTDPFVALQDDYADLLTSFDQSVAYFNQNLSLNSPTDIRLDIRESIGSYFTYWLISPAFSLSSATRSDYDFLTGMGGEKQAAPFPGFSFANEKGQNVKWMKFSSPLFDRVSLSDAINVTGEAIAYAYCTLESPNEREVLVSLGFNRSISMFANGQLVFEKQNNRLLTVDEFQVPLKLLAGKNRILLKIEKGTTGWDFSFSIKDAAIVSSKNKYRIK